MTDLSDILPCTGALIIGGLFAFHTPPAKADPAPAPTFAQLLEQSTPMETCKAFIGDTMGKKYGSDYFGSSMFEASCGCVQATTVYGLDEANITNADLRSTITTLALDYEIQIELGKDDSDVYRAMIAFSEGKGGGTLTFTAEELSENAQKVAGYMPSQASTTIQLAETLPACQQVIELTKARFPHVQIQPELGEEGLLPMHTVMAIRALEYDQNVSIDDIDAILASNPPLALCKQHETAGRLRQSPDISPAKAEKNANLYCDHHLKGINHTFADASEAARNLELKVFVTRLYMEAYATSANRDDAVYYAESAYAQLGMTEAELQNALLEVSAVYLAKRESDQAERANRKAQTCPADPDYNYAAVDLRVDLETALLP